MGIFARSAALVGVLIVSSGSALASGNTWTEIARSSKLGVGFEVLTDSRGNWCSSSPKIRMMLDSSDKLEDPNVRAMWTKAMTFLKTKQCADMVSVTGVEIMAGDTVLATVASSVSSNWDFNPSVTTEIETAETKPSHSAKIGGDRTTAQTVPAEAVSPEPSVTEAPAGTEYADFSSKTWNRVQKVGLADVLADFDASSKLAEGPFYGDWRGELNCGNDDTTFWEAPKNIMMSVYRASDPQAVEIAQWYHARGNRSHTLSTAYIDGDALVTTRADREAIAENMVYRAQASSDQNTLVTPFSYHRFQCQITFKRVHSEPKTYIALQQRMLMAQQIAAEFEAAPWRGSDFGKVKGGDLTAICESITAWLKKYPSDHRTPLAGRAVMRHFSDADLVGATGWTAYDWMTSEYGDRSVAFEKWVNSKACRKSMSKEDYNLLRRVGYDKESWKALRSRKRVDDTITGLVGNLLQYPYMAEDIAEIAAIVGENPGSVFGRDEFSEDDVAQVKLLLAQVRAVIQTDVAMNIAATVNDSSDIGELRAAERKLAKLNIPEEVQAATTDKVRQYIVAYGNVLLTAEFDKLAALDPAIESLPEAKAIREKAEVIVAEYLGSSDTALVAASYADFFSKLEAGVFTSLESELSSWDSNGIEEGKTQERIVAVQAWQDTLTKLASAGGDGEALAALNSRLEAAITEATIQAANEEVASVVSHYDTAIIRLAANEVPQTFNEIAFVDAKIKGMESVGALDALDTLKAARTDFWKSNIDAVTDGLFAALTKADAEGDEKAAAAYERGIFILEEMLAENGDGSVIKRFAIKKDEKAAEFGAAAVTAAMASIGGTIDSPVDIVLFNRDLPYHDRGADRPWSRAAIDSEWQSKRLTHMESAISAMEVEVITEHFFEVNPAAKRKIVDTSMMFIDRSRFSKLAGAELLRQVIMRELDNWEHDYTVGDDPEGLARLKKIREGLGEKVTAFALDTLDDAEDDIEDMSDSDLEKWRGEFRAIFAASQEEAMKNAKALIGSNALAGSLIDSLKAQDSQIAVVAKETSERAMRANAAGLLIPETSGWSELTRDRKKAGDLVLAWTKAEAKRMSDWRCQKTRGFDDADEDLLEAGLLEDPKHTVQWLACQMDNGNLTVNAIVEVSNDEVEVQTQADTGEFWKFRFRVVEVSKGKFAAFAYEYATPFETHGVDKVSWKILRTMLSQGKFDHNLLEQMAAAGVNPSQGYVSEDALTRRGVQEIWDAIVAHKDIGAIQ